MKPISSMCAAAMTDLSEDFPFFRATTLPIASTRTSSARLPSLSSLRIKSRILFSKPGAPGVRQILSNKGKSIDIPGELKKPPTSTSGKRLPDKKRTESEDSVLKVKLVVNGYLLEREGNRSTTDDTVCSVSNTIVLTLNV